MHMDGYDGVYMYMNMDRCDYGLIGDKRGYQYRWMDIQVYKYHWIVMNLKYLN